MHFYIFNNHYMFGGVGWKKNPNRTPTNSQTINIFEMAEIIYLVLWQVIFICFGVRYSVMLCAIIAIKSSILSGFKWLYVTVTEWKIQNKYYQNKHEKVKFKTCGWSFTPDLICLKKSYLFNIYILLLKLEVPVSQCIILIMLILSI